MFIHEFALSLVSTWVMFSVLVIYLFHSCYGSISTELQRGINFNKFSIFLLILI